MSDIMFTIMQAIVTVSMVIIMRYVVPLLKQKVIQIVGENIYAEVVKGVKSVEQTFKGQGMGAAKKTEVIERVEFWANKHGISVTAEQIGDLIETAVFVMKNKGADDGSIRN